MPKRKRKAQNKNTDKKVGIFAIRSKPAKGRKQGLVLNTKIATSNPQMDIENVLDEIDKENQSIRGNLTNIKITQTKTVPATPMHTPNKSAAVRDTPVKAEGSFKSPGGTNHKVDLEVKYQVGGIGYIFMEGEQKTAQPKSLDFHETELDIKEYKKLLSEFQKSSAYQSIKEAKSNVKERNVTVSKNTINKAKRNPHRQQGPVVVRPGVNPKESSATKYVAAATDIFMPSDFNKTIPFRAEWLHLVCYAMLGEASQTIENLIAGTHEANTQMIPFEVQATKKIAALIPEGMQLTVRSKLLPGTQIGTNISYEIVVPGYLTLPLNFNPLDTTQPPRELWDYVNGIVVSLILGAENARNNGSIATPNSTITTNTNTTSAPRTSARLFNPNKRYAQDQQSPGFASKKQKKSPENK